MWSVSPTSNAVKSDCLLLRWMSNQYIESSSPFPTLLWCEAPAVVFSVSCQQEEYLLIGDLVGHFSVIIIRVQFIVCILKWRFIFCLRNTGHLGYCCSLCTYINSEVFPLFYEQIPQISISTQTCFPLPLSKVQYTPLHWAAQYGHLEVASLLLGKGAGPSEKADYRDTPLHLACLLGHGAMVALLLESGADPFAIDEDGKVCMCRKNIFR